MLEALYAHIDGHFEAHLDRVRRFVRQPSISADGTGIPEMAELLATEVVRLGGRAEVCPTAGHPVVYGELDAAAPRTLLVYGMYDVQPVAGEVWLVPPFGGEIIDFPPHGPCLVSRGATNQKGPLACFFNVLETFKAVTGTFPLNFKLVIEGEEELGSPHLPDFIKANQGRLGADAVYFPAFSQDITGKVILYLGVKGIVFFELVCRGGDWGGPTTRAVHGSNAVWFHSPTWRLIHALATMLAPDQKHILVDGFYDEVEPPSAEDQELLDRLGATFTPETFLQAHEVRRFKYDLTGVDLLKKYLYQPTLNIDGIVSGHTAEGTKTVLPHEARAKLDCRLVPRMRPELTLRRIREHLDRYGFGDIELIVHDAYPWAKTSIRAEVVQALIKSLRDFGFEPEVWPHLGGSAPFYLFTEVLGLPFAMGGLGHGGRAHSPNEYATVEGMRLFEKSVVNFLCTFAGGAAG